MAAPSNDANFCSKIEKLKLETKKIQIEPKKMNLTGIPLLRKLKIFT